MRILLFLTLFLGLSATIAGQDTNEEAFQIYESGIYQAQAVTSYHQVSKGETLLKIANQNNVSVDDMKRWNNLNSNYITVGSLLEIRRIDYVLVEVPQLPEPELLLVSMDKNFAADIFENYVQEANKNLSVRNSPIPENSFKQLQLLAITNNIEYRVKQSQKKSIFNSISNTANNALYAVKTWGNSVIDKVKIQKNGQAEVFYANHEESQATQEENKAKDVLIAKGNTVQEESIIKKENASSEMSLSIPSSLKARKIYHKVRIGETMTQIATRYNVTKEDIIRWNNLNSSIAKVTQRLLIYTPRTSASLSQISL